MAKKYSNETEAMWQTCVTKTTTLTVRTTTPDIKNCLPPFVNCWTL